MDEGKAKKPYRRGGIRVRTNKILDRLTYSPQKHKQKFVRKLRQKLPQLAAPANPLPVSKSSLKFGSININGLDHEAAWAVGQLLKVHQLDVRIQFL